MNEMVYLNGSFISKNEAFISPNDRGFNFADGVYEVIKYYQGKSFRYPDHIERLKRSLHEVRIDFDKCDKLEPIFQQLIEMNGLQRQEAGIYLQITRGSHPRIHQFPENIQPTIYASAFPFSTNHVQIVSGIKVITTEDIRWLRCDIKSIALLPNVMLFQKAIDEAASEIIFVRNGVVTEASHSNFMGVKDGVVLTHPDSNLVLPGITKKVVLEICRANGIEIIEEGILATDLLLMDEMMITGTGSEITPVVNIDGTNIKDGLSGPVTRFIQERFFEQTKNH